MTYAHLRRSVALGDKPEAWSHGEWLGGWDRRWSENRTGNRDILGNVVEGSQNLPYSLAFFRWADLLENQKAEPVTLIATRYSRCDFLPNTLYFWDENVVSFIDLNGDEPDFRLD